MADYVLVHGGNMTTATWNKLTKADPVYTIDGAGWVAGYGTPLFLLLPPMVTTVFAPTLEDGYRCNLSGHIRQICELISENGLWEVILGGHSYGGMVITGVADKIQETVGGIGIHLLDDVRRRSAEIGYWLSESYWGKGIVTDAVSSLIPVAFERFDIVSAPGWDLFKQSRLDAGTGEMRVYQGSSS